MVKWNNLESVEQLEIIRSKSDTKPQLIFKHSTRCNISSMAKGRLERELPKFELAPEVHYLDLLKFRSLSNLIANSYGIEHQSPQALLIYKRNCIYNESHGVISVDEIMNLLKLPESKN